MLYEVITIDGPRALHLQRNASAALAVGREQHGERGGMAEQRGDFGRMVAALEHSVPGGPEADEPSADVQLLEDEALDVIGCHRPRMRPPAGGVNRAEKQESGPAT